MNVLKGYKASMPENVHIIEWHELDKRKFYVTGPSLFLGVRMVVYPPMLIKTRIMVQKQKSMYNGTFDAFAKIWKYEGIRGFYKGFLTNSFTLVSGQIYITTYEVIRSQTEGYPTFLRGFIAGACASFVGQTILVPIDVVSQRLMVQGQMASQPVKNAHTSSDVQGTSSKQVSGRVFSIKAGVAQNPANANVNHITYASGPLKLKGPLDIIREIIKNDGPRGFYRGYIASLMTFAPSSSIWWSSYSIFLSVLGSLSPTGTPHIFVQGVSGPLAGIVAAIATNPIDVIRTRLQVN